MQYRDDGYLPEALLNYLVRLGWSHGDQEIFSVDEMVTLFQISDVNKSASTFNTEKLLWINQEYIKKSSPEHIARHLSYHLSKEDIDPSEGPSIVDVITIHQDRVKTLVELAQSVRYFYQDVETFDEKAAKKNFKAAALAPLEGLLKALNALDNWQADAIHQVIIDLAESLDLKMGKVAQPFRVAITGGAVSPSIDITAQLIGRDRVLKRLKKACEFVQSKID